MCVCISAGNGRWGRDRGVSGTDWRLSERLDLYFHALYFYLHFVCMTCVSFCCHLKGKQKNHLDQMDDLFWRLCLKELGRNYNRKKCPSSIFFFVQTHPYLPSREPLFFKVSWSHFALTCNVIPWADWKQYSTAKNHYIIDYIGKSNRVYDGSCGVHVYSLYK